MPHEQSDAGVESEFLNSTPASLKRGDVIVERNDRGKVVTRAKVTDVNLAPAGCTEKVHVATVGGTVWCYEKYSQIETE